MRIFVNFKSDSLIAYNVLKKNIINSGFALCMELVKPHVQLVLCKYMVKKLTAYMSVRRTWVYVQYVMRFFFILKHLFRSLSFVADTPVKNEAIG